MSRRGNTKPATVQLFPFLAVLICTMGALVVLLHAFAERGRDDATGVAKTKQLEQAAKDQIDAEFFQWRSTHLKEAREKTLAQLKDEQLKLSHVEDHFRRLRGDLDNLKVAATELERSGESSITEADAAAAELADTQSKIELAKSDLDAARSKKKGAPTNYSIVPYKGPNGTDRRPIYIECREDMIILQPEGIKLSPRDFLGFFGPGNPLASALRAQREYLARAGKTEEPYPLLLVRPEGVKTYYIARLALDSWGSDFGYELVAADWELKFPERDPRLAELLAEVVADARLRQREYVMNSPTMARRKNRPVYRANPGGGGVSQLPGTGGPEEDMGGWDDYEEGSLSTEGRGRGGGGSGGPSPGGGGGGYGDGDGPGGYGDGPGGHADGPRGYPGGGGGAGDGGPYPGGGDGDGGPYPGGGPAGGAGDGLAGGGRGGRGGLGEPGGSDLPGGGGGDLLGGGSGSGGGGYGRGNRGGYNMSGDGGGEGSEFAVDGRYSGKRGTGGPNGQPGGTNGQPGGRGGNGNGGGDPNGVPYSPDDLLSDSSGGVGVSAAEMQDPYGDPLNPNGQSRRERDGRSGEPGGSAYGSSRGKAGSGARGGKPGDPNGDPNGQPGSEGSLAHGSPDGASGGSPSSGGFSDEGQPIDSDMPQGGGGAAPPSHIGTGNPAPHVPPGRGGPRSMASSRGAEWGLNGTGIGAIAASRPILVKCYPDKLVLMPESRTQQPREIRLGPHTEDAMDQLVTAVHTHMTVWGKAGRGLYWRPTLALEVQAGGEMRFNEIKSLMANSGFEVDQYRPKVPGVRNAKQPSTNR